jgi:hypothetical protein
MIWPTIWNAFLHFIGVRPLAPSGANDFWSGFGSDLAEFSFIGVFYVTFRKHNCHVKWCWRIGRQKVDGTDYVVCRRHHPKEAPTHAEVLQAHEEAQQ